MNMIIQANIAGDLVERFREPLDHRRSSEIKSALSAIAAKATEGKNGTDRAYKGSSDVDEVIRLVLATESGRAYDPSDNFRPILLRANAAACLAGALRHDSRLQELLKAIDAAAHAANSLSRPLTNAMKFEPGHVLPISTAVGLTLLKGGGVDETNNAIGIASSMTVATRNPMDAGRPDALLIGLSCGNGMLAALLAMKGVTASRTGLEGARGWLTSLGISAADQPSTVGGIIPDTGAGSERRMKPSDDRDSGRRVRHLYPNLYKENVVG